MRSKAVRQRIIRNRVRRYARWQGHQYARLVEHSGPLIMPMNHGQSSVREYFRHWQQLIIPAPKGPEMEHLRVDMFEAEDYADTERRKPELIVQEIKYLG
jgi:hypothetical protein